MADNRSLTLVDALQTDVRNREKKFLLSWEMTSRLARTNKALGTLFQQSLAAEQKTFFPRLLKHVVFREYEEIEEIVKKYPLSIFLKGSVTDHRGRDFENISSVQIARWNMDIPIFNLLKKYLPKERYLLIKEQLLELQTKGTKHGATSAYFYENLNDAYRTYIEKYKGSTNTESAEEYARMTISKIIQEAPLALVDSYCNTTDRFDAPLPLCNPYEICNYPNQQERLPWLINEKTNPALEKLVIMRGGTIFEPRPRHDSESESELEVDLEFGQAIVTPRLSEGAAKYDLRYNIERLDQIEQAFNKVILGLDPAIKPETNKPKNQPNQSQNERPCCPIF